MVISAGANDNGNKEVRKSDNNSSTQRVQKSETTAESLDEGHETGK